MIKIKAQLYVQGRGVARDLADITIWTEIDNAHHGYRISLPDVEINGQVKKRRSAHQNILHVLQEVLDNADLKKLGEDYIPRGGVIR